MKIYNYLLFIFSVLPLLATAQKTKEIKKTVEVEIVKENNDTKTIIRTNENGKVKEEIFKGKESDVKLKEVRKEYNAGQNNDHSLQVEVNEVNGKKTVKVTETIDGKVTVTEYEGKEADKKLKELQVPMPPKPKKKSKGLKTL